MIYFVRHGQTDWNKLGRIQGHSDTELNEEGKNQAQIVKEKLNGIKFDKVFSSPLKRAKETAQIICNQEIIFDDITTGVSSDIKKATQTARRMVTRYGMSDHIGVINYDDDGDEVFIGRDLAHAKSHSEYINGEIDKEVKSIIDECYKDAKKIILEHKDVLDACAELLLEKEKITREEFEALF